MSIPFRPLVLAAYLALPLLLTQRAPAQEGFVPVDIPRLDGVAIDGDAGDWGETGFRVEVLLPIDTADEPLPLKPVTDHDAHLRLAWDDAGLLVLVEVRDDTWIEEASMQALGRFDAVDLYLAPHSGSPDLCQWVVTPGMSVRQPEVRTRLHDYRKSPGLTNLPARIEVARTALDPATALLEIRLPWAALGIEAKVGAEAAFQAWSKDGDDPEREEHYYAAWYPKVGTFARHDRVHTLRLARDASPPVAARAVAAVDMDRLDVTVRVAGPADRDGSRVALQVDGVERAAGVLSRDASGRAVAAFHLGLPPAGEAFGVGVLAVAGAAEVPVELPDVRRRLAEALLWTVPTARPGVFSGTALPEVAFERPLWLERLVGPHEVRVTYLGAHGGPVPSAEQPGRYGAVAEVVPETGRPFRRFVPLYRTEQHLSWWRHDLTASLDWPGEALGIRREQFARYPEQVAGFVKWQIVEGLERGSAAAGLFAGLRESGDGEARDDFYTSPEQKNRQWWVQAKRKLYGWDRRWPDPFVCPDPIDGEPAPVVREGTLAEAGMAPDAAAQIDAVLQAWAADSDEAFAVCIVRRGIVVLHKAYGMRDGEPMTVSTPSWMASITKLLSGTLLSTFVDRGLVDLDAPVGDYLPPLKDLPTNKPLLVRHLYTHTSGLDWHWGAEDADMEERIAALLPHVEVGVRYHYNGTGFDLGSKILEAISGESLPNLHRHHLLGPLGCLLTTVPDGGGGTLSVPLDMARIGQMLLNRGAYGALRFFGEETFEKLLPRRLTGILGEETKNVYGLGTSSYGGPWGEGTFGHGAASAALFRVDPEHDLVVVMTRNAAGRNFGRYQRRFIGAVLAGIDE